jgi:sarcosine/dimethylglycine N-methyltransferase
MQPIYDRINLSKMGTISNYKAALEECGFTNISTDLHSENISTHYGHVLEVTQDKGKSIGLSELYLTSAMAGLKVWKEKSPGNIVWGIIAAQKTHKVDLDNIVGSN